MAFYEIVIETLWLKSLGARMNMNIDKPATIHEDDSSWISIANKNPTSHRRLNHIDMKYHFPSEQVENI